MENSEQFVSSEKRKKYVRCNICAFMIIHKVSPAQFGLWYRIILDEISICDRFDHDTGF